MFASHARTVRFRQLRRGTVVFGSALVMIMSITGPALATEAPVSYTFVDRVAELATIPTTSGLKQLAPSFTETSAGRLALGAYNVDGTDTTLIIGHLVPSPGADIQPILMTLSGPLYGQRTGRIQLLASEDPRAAVVEDLEISMVASGPGENICGAAGAGAFYTLVRVIKLGSGLVGAIAGEVLGAYACSMGNAPVPFGDSMTLANYVAPPTNEVFFTWPSAGPDYTVAGEYYLKSKVCVSNPSATNDDCYGLNTSGFYRTGTLFMLEIFWPDGSYVRTHIPSATRSTSGQYYKTLKKKQEAGQGDYITGFSLSEHGHLYGLQTPIGAARHHVIVGA